MTAKFVSPGVFTTELDQSQLAAGVSGIGAVMIGRTPKGPAFTPTIVQGYGDFTDRFGGVDPDFQLPYAARNYLKNGTALTIVRTLGHKDGTTTKATNTAYPVGWAPGFVYGIADAVAGGRVLLELHSKYAVTATGVAGSTSLFAVAVVSGTTQLFGATASFDSTSANYITKVLNTDPTKYNTQYHYVYRNMRYATASLSSSWNAIQDVTASLDTFTRDFEGAQTTWVKSQLLGGQTVDLFRFHTRASGLAANDEATVVIQNIKPSANTTATPYGTFDVVVRNFYDTDHRQELFETFIGCDLDPSSKNYILRRIGDQVETFDTTQRKFIQTGTWPAKSKKIWIEMNTAVSAPAEALPWGFGGYPKSAYLATAAMPDLPYVQNQLDAQGNVDSAIVWGVQMLSGGIVDRMYPMPDGDVTSGFIANDANFSLACLVTSSDYRGNTQFAYVQASSSYTPVYVSSSIQNFKMPFYGGHDGWDIRVKDPLLFNNTDTETTLGVVALKRAVDTVANPDAFDMNLLGIPAITNLKVTDYGRAMVNNRQDAMYVMDITGSSVSEAVAQLQNRQIDDNYTAVYYPDLKLNDTTNNTMVRVAPSVAVMGAIAYSDSVSQPWFAPAGLNRGGLSQFDIKDVVDRLGFDDRNTLYENRINPIATFTDSGISVFGQKTLQIKASALDRVNVRRLLIFAKKTVASAAKYLLFEPDSPATWQRFTNMVNPILERIQQAQGLQRFKVVMDSSTNTSDTIDRNIMVGKIFLQPMRSAEFIDLSFIITATGVEFGS